MNAEAHSDKWYDGRGGALLLAVLALLAAYLLGSRALDTGSWQQYFLAFVSLLYGLNRLFRSIWQRSNHQTL